MFTQLMNSQEWVCVYVSNVFVYMYVCDMLCMMYVYVLNVCVCVCVCGYILSLSSTEHRSWNTTSPVVTTCDRSDCFVVCEVGKFVSGLYPYDTIGLTYSASPCLVSRVKHLLVVSFRDQRVVIQLPV